MSHNSMIHTIYYYVRRRDNTRYIMYNIQFVLSIAINIEISCKTVIIKSYHIRARICLIQR